MHKVYFGRFDEPYRVEEKIPFWKRDKFWITIAIVGCYFLLIGFVILLLLLTPRFSMSSSSEGYGNSNVASTYGSNSQKKPFRPSQKDPLYEIDPRSTLDELIDENNNTFPLFNETSSEHTDNR